MPLNPYKLPLDLIVLTPAEFELEKKMWEQFFILQIKRGFCTMDKEQ